VNVARAASRLEVTVTARIGARSRVRVGHFVDTSTRSGTVAFSVRLAAKARRIKRSLPIRVAVALTPPDGRKLTHTAKATVRPD
jgi:hypothetical protein